MPAGSETLNFLWTVVARAAAAFVVAAVLLGLQRHYRRGYLRNWAWSWLFLCLYLAATALGIFLFQSAPASATFALLAAGVGQVAGYLQLVYLLFGSWEFALGRRLDQRLERIGPLAAIGAGAFSMLAFAHDPMVGHFFRVGARSLVAATGFLLSSVAVLRRRGRGLYLGPQVVSLALFLAGFQSLYVLFASTYWYASGTILDQGLVFTYVDFVVQLLMGLGMVICLLEDERSAAEHLAYHDPLTELPNRQLFLDRLGVALARARREERKVAVICMNLDRFKVINDSLGHTVGDWVLHEASRRVQVSVRQGDTLARFGSDEFALLVSGLKHPEEAGKIALKLLESVQAPLLVEGRELFVTMSAGVSLFPDDGGDEETLLRNAGTALHRAKDKGRDTFQLYAPAMNEMAVERLAMEGALRKAVARDELVLHYQPIVEVASGRIVGAEALLRWRHPERGLLFPRDFIDLAEATGLITAMGPWILQTACAQVQAWRDEGHPEIFVALNLSARQFLDPELVKKVDEAIRASGLPPERLELEITESLAMQTVETTLETLRRLKALGVDLSIDDFGTGHSSLAYLKRFPIDRLKIDQSFVREMVTEPDDAAIVAAVLLMAKSLGLEVVAEGVERPDQLAFLRERGCEKAQGFLFSRGVEPAAFQALLQEGVLPAPARVAAS
jgi:diguanylate cyclase (GGDEF)-like protein